MLGVSLALLGVGVALEGVAAIAGWRLGATRNSFETAPNESLDELMELDRLAKSGRRWATVANVTLIAGGITLAGGVAALVVDRINRAGRSGKKEPTAAVEMTAGGIRVRF